MKRFIRTAWSSRLTLAMLVMACACLTGVGQTGCAKKQTPQVEQLASAYVEISLLAEQYRRSDSTQTTETYQRQLAAALRTYGMTPQEFRAAVDSIAQQPAEFSRFYELVNQEILVRKSKQ
ncbi:MAG: hypothetical protein HY966_03425 [Ignavibacteriales bacterium]|nr:hypothetical protein [Ignavibacteriales bacterium]